MQPSQHRPVERFQGNSGRFFGVFGLVLAVVVVGYVAVAVHTATGLQVALGAVAFGVLVWVTQLRPRVTAYDRTLVLHNMLRDTVVPLAVVDDVAVRQALHVWVDERRYVCVGIGRSMRSLMSGGAPRRSMPGFGRLDEMAARVENAHPRDGATSYAEYVETRLHELVSTARREEAAQEGQVRPRLALVPVVLLVVSVVAFAGSLYL